MKHQPLACQYDVFHSQYVLQTLAQLLNEKHKTKKHYVKNQIICIYINQNTPTIQ
jgi:predicted kinase